MKTLLPALVVGGILLGRLFAAKASAAPTLAVDLVPHATAFPSFAAYEETLSLDQSSYHGGKITSAEIEIRYPRDKVRVVRFPYIWTLYWDSLDDQRALKISNESRDLLDDSAARRLRSAKPGEYQIAFYVNGRRASNVVSVRIDPTLDTTKMAPLELYTVEANPSEPFGKLAVLTHGPTPFDPDFINDKICFSPITVDGVERTCQSESWEGPVGPLPSGQSWWFQPTLTDYLPAIAPHVAHTINFKFGKYVAAPLRFDPADQSLNRAWDAMTPEIKDAATALPIQLEGTVTHTTDGKPLANCEVTLSLQAPTSLGGRRSYFTEYTDLHGHYAFAGVPPGTYRVGCGDTVKGRGYQFENSDGITLGGTTARHYDISGY